MSLDGPVRRAVLLTGVATLLLACGSSSTRKGSIPEDEPFEDAGQEIPPPPDDDEPDAAAGQDRPSLPPVADGPAAVSDGAPGPADAEPSRPDPNEPGESGTESVPAGTVRAGWAQLDIGKEGDRAGSGCPDPDPMVTKGTVAYDKGLWTLTGSGEGFIHGWDQGNLVYYKTKLKGDFVFTAKVETFEMVEAGKKLNGAAEALINVRQDLNFKQPTHSVITGIMPGSNIFMARYFWDGEKKWWHWPAWPNTWPVKKPWPSWIRLQRKGKAFTAFHSLDGTTWTVVEERDTARTWYPFTLDKMPDDVYLGLVCSARNDRNLAGQKTAAGCWDPNGAYLRQSARCQFSHVSLAKP